MEYKEFKLEHNTYMICADKTVHVNSYEPVIKLIMYRKGSNGLEFLLSGQVKEYKKLELSSSSNYLSLIKFSSKEELVELGVFLGQVYDWCVELLDNADQKQQIDSHQADQPYDWEWLKEQEPFKREIQDPSLKKDSLISDDMLLVATFPHSLMHVHNLRDGNTQWVLVQRTNYIVLATPPTKGEAIKLLDMLDK